MRRLILLLICIAAAGLAQCQEGLGTPTLPRIQGYVKSVNDSPVEGVKLELVRLNPDGSENAVVDTRVSGKDGRFRFKRSKDHDYHVRVHAQGRSLKPVRVRQGSVAMLPGGGLMNFVFYLDEDECVGISLTE